MNLSRDAIVKTALNIMDAYGLPDVSMRRISSTLGVQPSALYWHFSSKQDLLAAMTDVILADLPQCPGDLTRLPPWAARFHALLLHHPCGAELVWSVLCLQGWEEGLGFQIEQSLVQSGIRQDLAHAGAQGLLHLILGHAFDEDQRQQAARLKVTPFGPPKDSAKNLDDVVAIFLTGLRAC